VPPQVVIKKYPNRRLYDTSAGRYVNLDDVAAQIRNGIDLQVVDARTGEDLTRVVLTQIIMEEVKEQPLGLPLELLRQLILTTDRAGKEMLMWYLQPALDAYHKVQETAMSPIQMVKSLLSPAGEGELEQLRRRVAELEARVAAAPKRKARPKTARPEPKPRPRRKG
jgi:polyhydroxyalkanoate synthesis repressor PhaR